MHDASASGTIADLVKLAYVLDSWPRLSETFVRRELAIAARLHDVRVLALTRTTETVEDAEAKELEPLVSILGEGSQGAAGAALSHPMRFARAARAARAGRVEGTQRRFGALVRAGEDLRRFGVERIHAHFARWSTAAAAVLSAWTGAPFGFTAHAYDLFDEPTRFAAKARAASWVVTCSAYGGTEARRLAGAAASKVVTIRHGLDLATWSRATSPRSPGPLRVLAVGRLLPLKGFDVLVEAISLLAKRGVAAEARIVGDGEAAGDLAALVDARGLRDRVRLDGARSSIEVRDAMRDGADVIAVPSRKDRLPNTIAEAFACGRPVVATPVGGIRELVEEGVTGLLVPPDDAVALADALARLAVDPNLGPKLGAAGRARVEEAFDGERNVKTLLALIEAGGGARVP